MNTDTNDEKSPYRGMNRYARLAILLEVRWPTSPETISV